MNLWATPGGQTIVNASPLSLGDTVIIVGKKHPYQESATLLQIIMHPEKRAILVPQKPDEHRWGAPGGLPQIMLCVIGSILAGIPALRPFFLPMS